MSLENPAKPGLPVPESLHPRAILSAAWPLFKSCLPVCLPLAVIGVAAGATPGSEAALSGARSQTYSADWWGLTFASTVLTLICYGAVLRDQLSLAQGARRPVLDSIRQAAVDVPFVVLLLLLMLLPLIPAMLVTAQQGFRLTAALLTVAACLVLVFAWFAWPALVAADLDADARGAQAVRARAPLRALRRSLELVQGRWTAMAYVAGTLLAAVLVFVLLTGILLGMVMELAGRATATPGGLALSRWLMAVLLAVPVVYGGAVTVTAWRALSGEGRARAP